MGHVLVKNLCKEFVERRAIQRQINSDPELHRGDRLLVLNDVSIEFEDGELVCILGPSGCGKTTFARIVAGFDLPTSGTVMTDGKQVTGPSSDNIFVFQHSGLLPWMTVYENVVLGLRHIKNREEQRDRVQEYIDMVDLTGFESHYPHQLSGGMQRRAELARALVINPAILFMDEPFAGLDFLTRVKMREEVLNMQQLFRKTIIFITHDIDEALVTADRVVVFSDRPAIVRMDSKVEFPHPRDFYKDSALEDFRRGIYTELGVHYAL
jgi:ABC-type nitrate/sulfonate/bicarbonate transport system ATPase subunit